LEIPCSILDIQVKKLKRLRLFQGVKGMDKDILRKLEIRQGDILLEECRDIGGCPTGEARITRGYNLPARYVIHTVGPVYSGKPRDSQLLTNCYLNSLTLAVENNLATIAFPAISCGVYGYPIEDACKIAVDTSCNFLKTDPALKKIIFILFSEKDCAIYDAYLQSIS
jgi:O-acetyl-ADP-ribose deacetylase (regulator of RNase III)